MDYEIFTGDVIEKLGEIQDETVQCAVLSPPYYGLRSYLDASDPMKKYEIGNERTPQEYIKKMVKVFRGLWRVLKNDGTVWINIDDSYAGSNKGMGANGKSYAGPKQAGNKGSLGLPVIKTDIKNKSLMLIPQRLAVALSDDGWIVRCDVMWNKPNGMPESADDRPTRTHEYLFMLTKTGNYYYNTEAVLEPYELPLDRWGGEKLVASGQSSWDLGTGQKSYRSRSMRPNPNGRQRRSVWNINIEPNSDGHFAKFPKRLPELCILASSRPGDIVLDPFNGTGTTGYAALTHKRIYYGIELNEKSAKQTIKNLKKVNPVLFSLEEINK